MIRAYRSGPHPVPVQSCMTRLGNTRIHYRVAGDGPPLVLVHGYSASGGWWRRNISGLAETHRVYAPDLVGFGRSWPKRSFSLERAIEHVISWMNDVGLDSADFCGHSMGGQLCIRLAAAHPERVRRLVLVDSSGLPLDARLIPLAWRGVRSSGHTHFSFAPTVMRTALQAGPFVLLSALRELRTDDVREDLARIEASTLIVWGEEDVLVPLVLGTALHLNIPRSSLIIVPGAGHNVMYECPDEFNRIVLDFLAESVPGVHTTIVQGAALASVAAHDAL